MKTSKQRGVLYIGITILVLTIGVIAFELKINGIIDLSCEFRKLTGLQCPACGATRMVQAILRFDLLGAFNYNQFMFISIPFYLWTWGIAGVEYTKQGRVSDETGNLIAAYALSSIIWMILRNVGIANILKATLFIL
jgi:hypothetical protein